jgi:hypothetical protein
VTSGIGAGLGSARTRYLTDDGHLLFSTDEALLPADTNGVDDVYSYDPISQSLTLISTGVSAYPAGLGDASPSGDDVFIFTRQPLVGWDTDSLVDLYDVRLDGGYPEPRPVPAGCAGESCRPGAASPPVAVAPSSSQPGAGNPAVKRPCPRGSRRVKSKAANRRCVRKKKRRGKRPVHSHHRRPARVQGGVK